MLKIKKIISLVLCIALVVCIASISASGASSSELAALEKQASQIQSEINSLKKQAANQKSIKAAIDKQIANTQAQIDACNAQISKYNSQIAENQAEIDAKYAEIEEDKANFKKRIRAIYMSNTNSTVQILLGAESFSEYLQLAQMTKSVSAHDKALVNKIVSAIEDIEKNIEKNKELIESQKEVKATLSAKKAELDKQVAEVNSVVSAINAETKDTQNEKNAIDAQIAAMKAEMERATQGGSGNVVYDGTGFLWPTPGFMYISAGYNSNDSVHKGTHNGIDIAGGGIAGTPVRAIADGCVIASCGSCTHNYGKNSSCGCGGGYGNYVSIDHGSGYVAWYAHMKSITVGVGSSVKRGDIIGYVGTTGWSTGNHLHFGLKVNGKWVNPQRYSFSQK